MADNKDIKETETQPYDLQLQTFKVFTHPTRLVIVEILQAGESCVCHGESIICLIRNDL